MISHLNVYQTMRHENAVVRFATLAQYFPSAQVRCDVVFGCVRLGSVTVAFDHHSSPKCCIVRIAIYMEPYSLTLVVFSRLLALVFNSFDRRINGNHPFL